MPRQLPGAINPELRTLAARSVPPEELHAAAMRAWQLIEEGLATGIMSVSPERVLKMDDEQYLALVKWAAQYRQQAQTRAPLAGGLVGPSR